MLAAAVLLQPGSLLASPSSADIERVEPARSRSARPAYPSPGKPGECKNDADCGPGFACFHGGRCLCKPGRRLCKTTCSDLQNDAANCGGCGHACAAGDVCVQGGCRLPEPVSSLAITPQVTASKLFSLSYADGTDVCLGDEEAAPERAAVAGETGRFFVAYNASSNNWATDDNSWGTSYHVTPGTTSSGWTTSITGGDASATTSDFTGLNYLGYISQRSIDSWGCLGIAVATSDGITGNTFVGDGGVTCTAPGTIYLDAPTMKYDLGGTDLWAAYTTLGPKDVVQIMEDCGPGQPGCCTNAGGTCTATCSHDADHPCPVTTSETIDSNTHDQPTLAINPCTHNALAAYATSSDEIRIAVMSPDGGNPYIEVLHTGTAHDGNDGCCNGQVKVCNDGSHYCDTSICQDQPCMRMVARPQIVTTEIGGSCYAYVAYDTSATASNGHRYFTAYLDVLDVTEDEYPGYPAVLATYPSKQPGDEYNTFGHEVAAAGPYVAWGYYSQAMSACETSFEIREDNNGALSSINNLVSPPVSGYFPSLRQQNGHGLLDWVQGISRGVGPGGQLLMSWAEPVCMDSGHTCNTCNPPNSGCPSGQWSVVEEGTVITP